MNIREFIKNYFSLRKLKTNTNGVSTTKICVIPHIVEVETSRNIGRRLLSSHEKTYNKNQLNLVTNLTCANLILLKILVSI